MADDFVVAWGGDRDSGTDVNKMYVFDGESWSEMPAPEATQNGRWVNDVRGTSPQRLVAVGNVGLISHWDGREWRDAATSTDAHFTGLHVESEDEMFACALGLIVEGSANGWSQRLTTRYPIRDIAKFAGRVWLAGQEGGLLELIGDELVVVKDNIEPKYLEASETLLISCDHSLLSTEDGESFMGTWIDDVAEIINESRRLGP